MKVYTSITIDMRSGAVEHEESFAYHGQVAQCKGGSSGSNQVPETATEVTLSEITAEEWNRFKTTYVPLFAKLKHDVMSMDQDTKNQVSGMVNAGITQKMDEAKSQLIDTQAQKGQGPRAIGLGDVGRAKAETMTKGVVGGDAKVDSAKVAGLQNIVNMARGDAGQTMQGMGQIASQQVSSAIRDKAYDQDERNDIAESIGTVGGMGSALYLNRDKFYKK